MVQPSAQTVRVGTAFGIEPFELVEDELGHVIIVDYPNGCVAQTWKVRSCVLWTIILLLNFRKLSFEGFSGFQVAFRLKVFR